MTQQKKEILPTFDTRNSHYKLHQTINPNWKQGSGANKVLYPEALWEKVPKSEVTPSSRSVADNYKLLISTVTPRPIALISSINPVTNTENLAPFSFFNVVNVDPPLFCVGISGGPGRFKDTPANILATGECTINIMSEWFVEAANYTCIDSPPDVSEWELSGLTPLPSTLVKPQHVQESAFSIEGKLVTHHKWYSEKDDTKQTGTLLIIQAVNFHIRDDLLNESTNEADMEKLKPVGRLGGVVYSTIHSGFDLPKKFYQKDYLDQLEN
ncbi:hypothetical protein BABINDRAFT_164950 [Babjeviella inositovora NRRL Y-12698]|uniref:Flavin reductase like domain-containing protein n=1 Tax=Babjeviella inositovora NRRL Y-12698 TaxID=984486 RepID=A0A1E3R1I1_9ASCO|nr:uncharacterized protein BABINDRAFT_164950 [Babjeviella inositovora NRRL Y-12698]ODQ83257.1 hypothetical protein BABINDRAFT_164950 [Babjeviella inositovora NRRL Y-12698]